MADGGGGSTEPEGVAVWVDRLERVGQGLWPSGTVGCAEAVAAAEAVAEAEAVAVAEALDVAEAVDVVEALAVPVAEKVDPIDALGRAVGVGLTATRPRPIS